MSQTSSSHTFTSSSFTPVDKSFQNSSGASASKQEELYFDNFVILKRISEAKFSVYLVSYPSTGQLFAMKIYPREINNPNFFFMNEIRFRRFKHPNVVNMVGYQANKHFAKRGEVLRLSYIVMEYAPYGDLFDFFMSRKIFFNEKLARTCFHQLVNGVEFLHSQGVAHLDLKLENILIGDDFQLKIADFDLSYIEGDEKVHALGSKCYRAPEVLNKTCTNPKPADIYSLGIILFMLQTQGVLPHLEDQLYKGVNLFELLGNNIELFWAKHCEFNREKEARFTPEFKELFTGMTRDDPKERLTIEQIKGLKWYNGEIYSPHELMEKMRKMFPFK